MAHGVGGPSVRRLPQWAEVAEEVSAYAAGLRRHAAEYVVVSCRATQPEDLASGRRLHHAGMPLSGLVMALPLFEADNDRR